MMHAAASFGKARHVAYHDAGKEPDDWVRITVARQLLIRKNDAALDVLDAIARQHSEFSGFAQRMAAQWRRGELKAWG
jgi:hypothetical protein